MPDGIATTDQPKSVYIALAGGIALAMVDLIQNHSIEASKEIVFGLLAYAGGRQLVKSFLKK